MKQFRIKRKFLELFATNFPRNFKFFQFLQQIIDPNCIFSKKYRMRLWYSLLEVDVRCAWEVTHFSWIFFFKFLPKFSSNFPKFFTTFPSIILFSAVFL